MLIFQAFHLAAYLFEDAQALDGSPAVRSTRFHAGYCSPTAASRRPSDCEHAAKGAWPLQQLSRANRSLAGCAVACHACRRCRYVSFSAENAECAWYQECDLSDLRQAPPGAGHDYQTVQVRREIANAPRPRQRPRGSGSAVLHYPTLRLAIATVVIGETEGGGIIGWCQGARNLRAALPERWAVTLVIVEDLGETGHVARPVAGTETETSHWHAGDCPEARVVKPDATLKALARACVDKKLPRLGALSAVGASKLKPRHGLQGWTTLIKWQLMSWKQARIKRPNPNPNPNPLTLTLTV